MAWSIRQFFLVSVLFFSAICALQADPVKIMFIGDSITAGKGYCWRYHLWLKLNEKGYRDVDFVGLSNNQPYSGEFDRDHEGYGGMTAGEVLKLSAKGIEKERPDIAVIHLGTNDFASRKATAEETGQAVGGIIDHLRKANPKVTIFLARIPLVPEQQREAVAFLLQSKADPESALLAIDLVTGWKMEPNADTVDYVHPNLNGALKISERIYEALRPLLKAGTPIAIEEQKEEKNLALSKMVESDTSAPAQSAGLAVDGDPLTWWAAKDTKLPAWLQVDLGTPQDLSGTSIVWDSAGAAHGYRIETSTDGSTWNLSVDRSKADEISVALKGQRDFFSAGGVRFVRVTVTQVPNESWTKYPAAIREFKIFGSQD